MAYDSMTPPTDEVAEGEPAPKAKKQGFTIKDLPNEINIAELLDEERLTSIGTLVWDEYDIDKKSRAEKEEEWAKSADAFSMKAEVKNFPFDKASNVKFPALLSSAIQYAARAMPAVIHDGKVAKGKVVGRDVVPVMDEMGQPAIDEATGQPQQREGGKQEQADRVGAYLNYQLLDKDTAWAEETDQGLHVQPVFGGFFKKLYRDPVYGNRSEIVDVRNFICNVAYPSLDRAPRFTQRFDLYPNEIKERKLDGRYLDIELTWQPPSASSSGNTTDRDKDKNKEPDAQDKSAPHEFLEQHRLLDLDEDGYMEPYIVTLHVPTKNVVRIVTAYDERDIVLNEQTNVLTRIKRRPCFVKYGFIPDPDGGIYDIGFGKLLMHPVEIMNSIINQLIDAGTLQNAGGGFIGKEFRLKSGELMMSPGKFKQVPFAGNDIRTAIYHMEHPGPSPVLFQMLGFLTEQIDNITSTAQVLTGEAPANQPATTTLALIEQGLKVFTGIIGRTLRSLGQELKVMYDLNSRYMPQDEVEYFNVGDDENWILGKDFSPTSNDVTPVADATVVTDMQRMARAEMMMMFRGDPMVDQKELYKRFLEAGGISSDGLLLEEPPPPPIEPKDQLAREKFEQIDLKQAELDGALKQTQIAKGLIEVEQMNDPNSPDNLLKQQEIETGKVGVEAQKVGMESQRSDMARGDQEMQLKQDEMGLRRDEFGMKQGEQGFNQAVKSREMVRAGMSPPAEAVPLPDPMQPITDAFGQLGVLLNQMAQMIAAQGEMMQQGFNELKTIAMADAEAIRGPDGRIAGARKVLPQPTLN